MTRRKRSFIEADDVLAAGRRWQEVSDNQDDFEAFILHGTSPILAIPDIHMFLEVPDETARRIAILLGPHYKAVIRAWYIRRDANL